MKQLQFTIAFLVPFAVFLSAQERIQVWQKQLPQSAIIRHSFVNKQGQIVVVGNWDKDQDECGFFAIYDVQGNPIISPQKSAESKFYLSAAAQAPDGGYWLLGRRVATDQMNTSILTLKRVNDKGELLRSLDLGKTKGETAQLAVYTEGVIICANIEGHLTVFRIAWDGRFFEKRWIKEFDSWAEPSDIIALSDGHYLVAGFRTNASKSFLKCFDTEGGIIWEKEYANVKICAATTDGQGQIWVTGTGIQHNKSHKNTLLMCVDKAGSEISRHFISAIGSDIGTAILYNSKENNFFIAGHSTSRLQRERSSDMCLWHISNDGQVRQIESPFYYSEGRSISKAWTACLLPNGHIFIAGESGDNGQILMTAVSKQKPIVAVSEPNKTVTQPNRVVVHPKTVIIQSPPSSTKIEWRAPDIIFLKENEEKTDKDKYTIKVVITTTDTISGKDIKVFLNETEVIKGKMDNEPIYRPNSHSGNYTFTYEQEISIKRDFQNKIEVVITTKGHDEHSKPVYIRCTKKPKLYLLSIGIPGQNLNYTSRDAEAMVEAYKTQTGANQLFDAIDVRLLNTDELTYRASIVTTIASLVETEKIQEQDLILVFISSHGLVSKDGTFIIQSKDFHSGVPNTGLKFKGDMLDELAAISCKKVYLVDACHSGGILDDPKNPSKATDESARVLLHWLNARNGERFIVSSNKDELSHELESRQHGAFTQAILEAFRNETVATNGGSRKADTNGDKVLMLSELYDFLRVRVPYLVKSEKNASLEQNPVSIKIEKEEDDLPIYKY